MVLSAGKLELCQGSALSPGALWTPQIPLRGGGQACVNITQLDCEHDHGAEALTLQVKAYIMSSVETPGQGENDLLQARKVRCEARGGCVAPRRAWSW